MEYQYISISYKIIVELTITLEIVILNANQ